MAASVDSNHCTGPEANIEYVQLIFKQMEARGIAVPGPLRKLFDKYKTRFDTCQTQNMLNGLSYQLLADNLEVLYDMSKSYFAEEEQRIADERRRQAEEDERIAAERRSP
jgi:hypothetical protein